MADLDEQRPVASSAARGARALLEEVLDRLSAAEVRPGQDAMVHAVADAIATGRHLVVRAGQGTGKSLGYLAPLVASGKRGVVATHTKALQDQLVGFDLRLFEGRTSYATLKGRANYPCVAKLEALRRAGPSAMASVATEVHLAAVLAELRGETAERGRLHAEIPDELWTEMSSGAEDCHRRACAHFSDCVAETARRRALLAQVLVANQSLLGVDIRSYGRVLGAREVVVIDEAHAAPDAFAQAFELRIGWTRLKAVATALSRAGQARAAASFAAAAERVAEVLERTSGRVVPGSPGATAVMKALVLARDALGPARARLGEVAELDGGLVAAQGVRVAKALGRDLDAALDALSSAEADRVCHLERGVLRVTPVELGAVLAERLWPSATGIVVSATLPASLVRRLGLSGSEVLDLGYAFDHHRRSLLYVPSGVPDPSRDAAGWARAVDEELARLVEASGGRALLLFTSRAAMRRSAEALEPVLARLGCPVLVQGRQPRQSLLARFRAEERSVLFATRGFFGGIDVPGQACVLVAIDRLPFPTPGDPIVSARRALVGSSGFTTVDLEEAGLALAQGAGRLMRRAEDSGVVCVLDPRLVERSYGAHLVAQLPPMRRTRDRERALRALRLAAGQGVGAARR